MGNWRKKNFLFQILISNGSVRAISYAAGRAVFATKYLLGLTGCPAKSAFRIAAASRDWFNPMFTASRSMENPKKTSEAHPRRFSKDFPCFCLL